MAEVAVRRRAMVLTAGHGTRLWPLTSVRAKPAIPVAGEPIIRRIIRWLVGHRTSELVLNLHHLPETLTASVGDGSDLLASVRYSWEQPAVLGSAGGPRQALPILDADVFFVVNGDTLTDLDPTPLAAEHASSGALVTLALVANTEPSRYGGVRLDSGGAVTGFVARGPAARGSYHFIGVQMACADAFRSLAPGEARNSVGGVYDDILRTRPGSIRGFVCGARFWDIGTPADYLNTSEAFLRGSTAETCLCGGVVEAAHGRRTRIDPTARLTRSIVWDDVEVGPECRLEGCIITDGVRLPARSQYRNAVLLAGRDGRVLTSSLADAEPAARSAH